MRTSTNRDSIRKARADEAELLSGLALRSKAHWGYSEEFLAACAEELTIHPQQIAGEQFDVTVATRNGEISGFYALARIEAKTFELHALFVEPVHIGSGIGRDLIQHALRSAAASGGNRLVIQGDPHAEKFYLAAGARQVGVRESESIPGRLLPLFEIALA